MLTPQEIFQLFQSLVWLLAGVGVFIVGMNFLGDALQKSAGNGMKRLLGKISNNPVSGVGVGAAVTAIIQSSSATSVMVIGLVNAGVLTLMQATPIIMGANIGTTVTGLLVALKNDYFNMAMYLLAFAGVMLGFSKKERMKLLGSLFCGLGLIFVGLNIMSSREAFGSPLIERVFSGIFQSIDFPLLLILVGVVFTALIQSSSAATGVAIAMVGAGILPLDQALFIVLGANIGTCVTALLASLGAAPNAKRVAFVHFAFNVIGSVVFAAVIWIFKEQTVNILVSLLPGEDPMSLQMRLSVFHVVFNVSTTLLLLPFTKRLVKLSCLVIKDRKVEEESRYLRYVDERLLAMPTVALMQVKMEIDYMFALAEENLRLSVNAITGKATDREELLRNEEIIDFTNSALTKFLIQLTSVVEQSDERIIGGYFHVLNDLERIGDHAENFLEIGEEMAEKKLQFSEKALGDLIAMYNRVQEMLTVARDAFENGNLNGLQALDMLEEKVDGMKTEFTAGHFTRLAEGVCKVEVSPYYSSAVLGLERVADHLVNVGYSIVDPTGDQNTN